jgi:flagellar motor switch/type III secretory pathway protein FliN
VSFEPPQLADGVSVTLRVHGREIGTGDLISIDDRLAVRITHLIGASAP